MTEGQSREQGITLTGSRTKPSPAVCAAPCAISDLYRKIDTKDVIMLSTGHHEMATTPPIRAILSNSGRVMNITEALRMMADCG